MQQLRIVLCVVLALWTLGGASIALGQDSEKAVIVLEDGSEITGQIIEETDDAVVVRSAFGKSTIKRSRIKEIRRGKNPLRTEFLERFERAAKRENVSQLFDLSDWALDNGLIAEQRRALLKIIDIEPNHERARGALGHARLDGEWVNERRVEELVRQGYRLDGLDLKKRSGAGAGSGNGGTPTPGVEKKDPPKEPGKTRKPRVRKELTPEEKKKQEKRRAKKRKEAEEFQRKKEKEYIGVPWSQRHKIKTPRFDIECNSTLEVAKTYQWIMENLYAELSRRFTQKHTRGGGRLPVFIYKTHEEFMQRTGTRHPGVGGFYNILSEQVHCYHGTFGLTQTTYNVLAHEGTHQFQGRVLGNLRNLPPWILEGLAVYFGDGSKLDYRKKKIVSGLIPRDRLFHIQDKMKKGSHEPLRTLISLPQARFSGSQYADGWSLVYFLFNDKKRGRKMIGDYWLAGTKRAVTRRDFEILADKYFGSMNELEEQWVEYTLALKPEESGRIEGDYFISDDFKFEIRRPTDEWVMTQDTGENNALIAMTIPDTTAKIEVRFVNNSGGLEGKKFLEAFFRIRAAIYSDFEFKKTTFAGLDGYELTFYDKVKGEDAEESDDDEPNVTDLDKKEEEGDEEDEEDVRRKYRSYMLIGLTKAYSIQGSAAVEDFEDFTQDFREAAESLELILNNRW